MFFYYTIQKKLIFLKCFIKNALVNQHIYSKTKKKKHEIIVILAKLYKKSSLISLCLKQNILLCLIFRLYLGGGGGILEVWGGRWKVINRPKKLLHYLLNCHGHPYFIKIPSRTQTHIFDKITPQNIKKVRAFKKKKSKIHFTENVFLFILPM